MPLDQAQLIEIGLIIGLLVLSLGLHEYAHARIAYACGDDTAQRLDRMTPNPTVHIDPFMTILLPAALWYFSDGRYVFGGAKPVPVVPSRLRKPLRDMMLVALAGPATNFLLAVVSMVLWKASFTFWGYAPDQLLPEVLLASVEFNLLLTVFNLLPIPPLDGSRVLAYFLPQSLRDPYVALERFGLLLVFGFVFFLPQGQEFLREALDVLWDLLYDWTGADWRD